MAIEILDNSGTYLRIFTQEFQIDYTLPKYKKILEKLPEEASKREEGVIDKATRDYLGAGFDTPISSSDIRVFDGDKKRQALLDEARGSLMDEEFFKNLSADELTIIVDKERAKGISRKFGSNNVLVINELFDQDTNVSWGTPSNFVDNSKPKSSPIVDNTSKKQGFFSRLFGKKKTEEPKNETVQDALERTKLKEPEYELDVLKFFDLVKLTTKQETIDYYNRIGPYLLAIKKAKLMGQTALIDQWLGRMFIAKYESFLRAKGFHHKITEAQLVKFVKKTKKGVVLTYVKNFSHPIPDQVLQKKLEADDLHVFDNYVILHYDPSGKVYVKTEQEKEKERSYRSDPILFGLIADSRDLYYITDWTDEYCDLTLDKFLEVSGLNKKSLEIGEKIKI